MLIKITPEAEHGVKTLEINSEQELFHEAFVQAAVALVEIIKSAKHEKEFEKLYGYPSNLIAFCGKRGQGKTSAMLSFSRALSQNSDKFKTLCGDRFEEISNAKFVVLPAIDPTSLEGEENILNVILSRLFLLVRDKWPKDDETRQYRDERRRRDLIKKFQQCMDAIAALKGKESISAFDSLERLERLGDSSKLKMLFYELIREVLGCLLGFSQEQGNFLVLQMDDTDLQMEHAYTILEDIRKYLTISNVIILMATDMDQLRQLVALHYSKQLSAKNDGHKNDGHKNDGHMVKTMAGKYMDKLVPVQRTIYLPQFEEFCRSEDGMLKLTYGTHIVNKNLQNGVLDLIYRKTGIIFVKPSSYLHNIIPTTFRGLIHLLNLLASMEDLKGLDLPSKERGAYLQDTPEESFRQKAQKVEATAQIATRNLKLFENYFLFEWCATKLEIEDYDRLIETDKVAPNQRIQKLYEDICARSKKKKEDEKSRSPYTSLVKLLKKLSKESIKESDYRFYFAVHTYLTIQFHKLMWRCRKNTVDQNTENHQADVFDYTKLVERLGDYVLADDLIECDNTGVPDYNRFEFSFPKEKTDMENGFNKMLLKEQDEKACFRMDRVLLGILAHDTKLTQSLSNLYYAQDYSLSILLNWDVQDQIYKHTESIRALEDKKNLSSYQFTRRFKQIFGYVVDGKLNLVESVRSVWEKNSKIFTDVLSKCDDYYYKFLLASDDFVEAVEKPWLMAKLESVKDIALKAVGTEGASVVPEVDAENFSREKNQIVDKYKLAESAKFKTYGVQWAMAWQLLKEACETFDLTSGMDGAVVPDPGNEAVQSLCTRFEDACSEENNKDLNAKFKAMVEALQKASQGKKQACETVENGTEK